MRYNRRVGNMFVYEYNQIEIIRCHFNQTTLLHFDSGAFAVSFYYFKDFHELKKGQRIKTLFKLKFIVVAIIQFTGCLDVFLIEKVVSNWMLIVFLNKRVKNKQKYFFVLFDMCFTFTHLNANKSCQNYKKTVSTSSPSSSSSDFLLFFFFFFFSASFFKIVVTENWK